uniref:Putative secreted protein n=1 Tax=Ixodes ricinus TaxID=34613 RepID=A0A6B0UET0_IXORI
MHTWWPSSTVPASCSSTASSLCLSLMVGCPNSRSRRWLQGTRDAQPCWRMRNARHACACSPLAETPIRRFGTRKWRATSLPSLPCPLTGPRSIASRKTKS